MVILTIIIILKLQGLSLTCEETKRKLQLEIIFDKRKETLKTKEVLIKV